MSTSSASTNTGTNAGTTISPAAQSASPPFRWLNPLRPTKFRVIVGLGFGAMVLLMVNLFVSSGLDTTAWLTALATAAIAYVLAEVLLVTIVVVGPFAGFVYGVIAFFSR